MKFLTLFNKWIDITGEYKVNLLKSIHHAEFYLFEMVVNLIHTYPKTMRSCHIYQQPR